MSSADGRPLLMWVGLLLGLFAVTLASVLIPDRSPEPSKSAADPTTFPQRMFRSPNPDEACVGEHSVGADVDGDGREDRVYQISVDGVWLGVCTAAGVTQQIEVRGMGQVFGIVDIEPDGRDEIMSGGTTVSSSLFTIVVLDGDELREATLGDEPLIFQDGFTDPTENGVAVWGCAADDGDGERQVVQLTASWSDHSRGSWTRSVYRLEGAVFTRTSVRRGSLGPLPAEGYGYTEASQLVEHVGCEPAE